MIWPASAQLLLFVLCALECWTICSSTNRSWSHFIALHILFILLHHLYHSYLFGKELLFIFHIFVQMSSLWSHGRHSVSFVIIVHFIPLSLFFFISGIIIQYVSLLTVCFRRTMSFHLYMLSAKHGVWHIVYMEYIEWRKT